MDVNVRQTICRTSYEDIWGETDLETKFDPSKFINCESCTADLVCPMRAITFEGDRVKRIKKRCHNCDLCVMQCIGGAFRGNLGAVNFESKKILVVLRQSDRARAIRLAKELKLQILDGFFKMTRMVDRL